MPFRLDAVDGSHSILLDRPIMVLGRDLECDVQLDSKKMSRRHCCLAQVDDHLSVRDLGSTNGIKVNDSDVREGTMLAGDRLTVGHLHYNVQWEDEEHTHVEPKRQQVVQARGTHPILPRSSSENPALKPNANAISPDDLLDSDAQEALDPDDPLLGPR